MRLLLHLLTLLLGQLLFGHWSVRAEFKLKLRNDCGPADHKDCDDRCKSDSQWYGFCVSFDGYSELSCKCFSYERPLDVDACTKDKQRLCAARCRLVQPYDNGYCYIQTTDDKPRGQTKCGCFKQGWLGDI